MLHFARYIPCPLILCPLLPLARPAPRHPAPNRYIPPISVQCGLA